MGKRLNLPEDALEEQALADELKRGARAARERWIQEGKLIGGKELSTAWGRPRQALEQACARGELFNIKVARRSWYPRAFGTLTPEQVAAVCRPLAAVNPVDQALFWWRPLGSLGGRTLADVLRSNQLQAAVSTAEAFAREQLGAC